MTISKVSNYGNRRKRKITDQSENIPSIDYRIFPKSNIFRYMMYTPWKGMEKKLPKLNYSSCTKYTRQRKST